MVRSFEAVGLCPQQQELGQLMNTRRAQTGVSSGGILIMVVLLVLVIKVVSGIGGAYYDFYTINSIITSLYRDGKTGSEAEFKRALSDRFQINNVRNRSPDEFTYRMTSSGLEVIVDYEVRAKMVGNLDLIAHFAKTYTSDQSKSQ